MEDLPHASEESYRTIFELASDAIFVHDIETGAILDANRKACELHGCTLDELKELGLSGISDGELPFDAEHAQAYVRRAADGEPQRFEWLVRRKTGERLWVEVSLHRVRILGSERVIASVRNIDERKQAEAALQRAHDELEARVASRSSDLAERTAELAQAEQRFRAVVEASPTPLLLSRLDDGTMLYANDRLEALLDVAPGSLIGQKTPDFYYDLADRPQVLETVRKQGYIRDLELRIKRADGTPRWVSLSVQNLTFDGVAAITTSFLDITERKQTEADLRQRTHEMEAIFRALPDLYFRMEADGTIQDYRAGRAFGLYVPPEAFLGQRVQEVLPSPVGPQVGEALEKVAQTRDLVHFEYMLPFGEERRDFEARLLPLPDGQVVAIVRDVTERKLAEEALRASEESYRGLFDSLSDLVYIQDLEGRFLNVNDAVLRTYGYTQEEILGQTPVFLAAPDVDLEETVKRFQQAVAGEPQRFEWWGRRKDGSIFPKEVVIKRSTYFGQDVVIAVARDISERVAAETALRDSEEHFRLLIENSSDVATILGPDGVNRYQSPSVERVLGYRPEEMVHTSAFERVHPEDAAQVREVLGAAISQPNTTHVAQFRYRHKDGSWRVLEATGRLLIPEDASAGIIVNSRDVTERKRAEATLRLQKTLLEAQGEASIDGILVVSEEGKILSYNQRFVEMWGLSPEVVASQSDDAAIQAVLNQLQDPEEFLARVEHLYTYPGETARDEIVLRDGRVFDRYSAPVISNEGDYYGRIWFFRDMTAQKRHAEELEQARQEAEHAREEASRYARSMERELEFGRKIQEGLLPATLPQPAGWEIAVHFCPVWQVAGDFYDAFELPNGHIGLIIADVSGKGVGAALFMALFQSLLRASAERASAVTNGPAPSDEAILTEAITSTNDYITRVHKHAHMFASVFFGLLDPETGTLHYVNAGHEPPVVIGQEGTGPRLLPTGPALGLMAGAPFEVSTVKLASGEMLLAYTDGVTEARNGRRDFFTEERLLNVITQPAATATTLLDRIEQAVCEFADKAAPSDDLTLLAVRRGKS
ncbi:MAG TPA: PAS domain S-box protein [Rhodothermales bacterium]|nr:PAS domain S-box protein [Rhodothermales bacterium]